MLLIDSLSKKLGSYAVLNEISCILRPGEIVGILGPSGAGKTTFLRCLANLTPPDRGRILLNQRSITKLCPGKIGFVSQHYDLFANFTINENISYAPIHVLKNTPAQAAKKTDVLLRSFGLLGKKSAYPSQLSGGQQQRVAIARALVMEPQLLLFDEPTSALDPQMAFEVMQLLQDCLKRKILIVLVSHDLHFIEKTSSRILFLNKGSLVEDVSAKQFFHKPKHPSAQSFLKNTLFAR